MAEHTKDLDMIMQELDKICINLEDKGVNIKDALKYFKNGITLINEAEEQLEKIDSTIQTIKKASKSK